jgi:hypothetical protein
MGGLSVGYEMNLRQIGVLHAGRRLPACTTFGRRVADGSWVFLHHPEVTHGARGGSKSGPKQAIHAVEAPIHRPESTRRK